MWAACVSSVLNKRFSSISLGSPLSPFYNGAIKMLGKCGSHPVPQGLCGPCRAAPLGTTQSSREILVPSLLPAPKRPQLGRPLHPSLTTPLPGTAPTSLRPRPGDPPLQPTPTAVRPWLPALRPLPRPCPSPQTLRSDDKPSSPTTLRLCPLPPPPHQPSTTLQRSSPQYAHPRGLRPTVPSPLPLTRPRP